METLKPHLGNYEASVTGQSVWRDREVPEEEVSKMERETRKKKTYMKTLIRLRFFLSLLTCPHQIVGRASHVPPNPIMSQRRNKYFLISSFSRSRLPSSPHFADRCAISADM